MKATKRMCIGMMLVLLVSWGAGMAYAAVPAEWLETIPTTQYVMGIMGRVKLNGTILNSANGGPGSYIAAFYGNELRGVAEFDDEDEYYFYNLTVHTVANTEKGYTFKFYNPATDEVIDCAETLDFTALGYGTFDDNWDLVPQIFTVTTEQPQPELPVVSIVATDATAGEPGNANGTGTFTVSRKTPDGNAVTKGALAVYLQIAGTAVNGKDYTTIKNICTIAAGASQSTITVTALEDLLTEGDETVVLTIAANDDYAIGTAKQATVTIKDVTPCVISTAVNPAKGGTVTGNGTYAYGSTVTLKAAAATGYTFENWTLDNAVVGTSSTLTLTNVTSGTFAYTANFAATAPVVTEPIITITANDPTATEGNAADTGQFTITRRYADGTNYTSGSVSVKLQIAGTATNGVDYTTISSTSEFASGSYRNTKTVTALEDVLEEGDETVIITILPGDGYSVGAPNTATVTIKNVPPVKYTITTKVEPADSGTVTGGGMYAKGAEVKLTATPNADYRFVKWTKGTSTTSVSTANPYSFTASDEATYVAVFEKKVVVEPIVTITANDTTASEPGGTYGTGQFTIKRKYASGSNYTSGTTTVNLQITGTATNGVDYAEISTTSPLRSGKASNTKTVTPLADDLEEADETVIITILPGEGYTVGEQNSATVTIKSHKAVVEPIVTITANDILAGEPGGTEGTGQFTITRKKASGANYTSGTTTVNLQITGTATNGVDYTTITNTSKIASGKYKNTKTVTVLKDALKEGDETVIITILPGTGYSVGEENTATVTIKDFYDEPEPPAAPVVTATTDLEDRIIVSWISDGAYFTISRAENADGTGKVALSTNQTGKVYVDTTAEPGKAYTYFVVAKYATDSESSVAGTAQGMRILPPVIVHPVDTDEDMHISGSEYLNYMAVAKNAAIFGYEIVWDGQDVLSMARYSNGSSAMSGELTRMVSSHVYGAGSTVTVMYAVSNPADITAVFTGDVIPEGWTLENANGGVLADGVIRFSFDYPDIPAKFSYTLRAPQTGLKSSYILADSGSDTAVVMMTDSSVIPFAFSDTLVKGTSLNPDGSFHPADSTQDNHISGLEYLAYAGAAKSIALSHDTYTWDGHDVLTLAPANGTRSGASGVQLARRLSTTDYAAGTTITVTLDIQGAADMTALFLGEIIPAGWTVTDAAGGTLVNGVLKFAFEAPAIPAAVSYTIVAPTVGLKAGYAIRSSADTGCYARGVVALAVEDTVLGDATCGIAFDEWPLYSQYYTAVVAGEAVVFNWPAIHGADSYLLTVYDAAGAVVAAKSVAATSALVEELPYGACCWDVTANGMTSPAALLGTAGAAITDGFAADDAVILYVNAGDAVIDCDVMFFSAVTGEWTSMTVQLNVIDGAARLELGQPAAGGYLCIRPQGAADYTELFLE